jgi:hypothetical protein
MSAVVTIAIARQTPISDATSPSTTQPLLSIYAAANNTAAAVIDLHCHP